MNIAIEELEIAADIQLNNARIDSEEGNYKSAAERIAKAEEYREAIRILRISKLDKQNP